jgi:hypothetical protein
VARVVRGGAAYLTGDARDDGGRRLVDERVAVAQVLQLPANTLPSFAFL